LGPMGAVTSHCVADRPEEGGCTFDPHDATIGEHGYSAGGCAQLNCDLGEQFLVASNIRDDALNDKECADVVLVQAVMRGDLEDVKKAMANDATVDTFAEIALFRGVRDQQRIKQVTPLMRACDCGRDEVVSYLLRHRADPLRQDSRKFNALCYALGAGELALARVLLEESPHTAKMQQVAAWRQAEEIMDQCEEAAGHEVAEELRKDFPFLLLTPQEICEQFKEVAGHEVAAELRKALIPGGILESLEQIPLTKTF